MNNNCQVEDGLPVEPQDVRPWGRALIWLLLLGPFFFISYNSANWLASQQGEVLYVVFEWEHYIPFVPWTILPYWVIDALYVISLFVCATKMELDSHARRLLTAQVIAVAFFILIPMGFSFERPSTDGFAGDMFVLLSSFDQPFNQAPSLHIALLVILWGLFIRHLPRIMLWPFHVLCFLIGVSVLTTYQHHFIDVPTGALLGWFCVWLWPENGQMMFATKGRAYQQKRRRIALFYFSAASLLCVLALYIGNTALWLFWPAASLLLVSVIYFSVGSAGFQKSENGVIKLSARCLLWPYLLAARLNSRFWTRNNDVANHITEAVWLGRFPSRGDIEKNNYSAVIDMTAEFSAPKNNISWHAIPCLDLITADRQRIMSAADLLEQHNANGPVLVSCALGYSRSAVVVMAWLLSTRRVRDVEAALQAVQSKRPCIVIKDSDIKVLTEIAHAHNDR